MTSRLFITAALLSSSLLAACSGDDGGGGTVTPTGAFHHYVINTVTIPKTQADVDAAAQDIDGDKVPDNKLGGGLMTLMNVAHFDLQGAIDVAIQSGSVNLLPDLQTADYTTSGGAGLRILLGTSPTPDPTGCMAGSDGKPDPQNAACGADLKGTGMFQATASDEEVDGKIAAGTFTGGPGEIQLQLNIAGANLLLHLVNAKATASGISDAGITSLIVGGAIKKTDIDGTVVPAIAKALNTNIIPRDCNMLGTPTGADPCGCTAGSTGATVISTFDIGTHDCNISNDEIANNEIAMPILKPDLTIAGEPALSVGLKTTAVAATFTVDGQ